MGDIAWYFVAVGLVFLYAVLARPMLGLPGCGGWWTAWAVAGGVLTFPLLLPGKEVMLRAALAFSCGELFFKLIDFSRARRVVSEPISFTHYLHFLVPFPLLLVVYRDKRWTGFRAPSPLRLLRMFAAAAALAGVISIVIALEHSPLRYSCWLDHAIKLLLFTLLMHAGSKFLTEVEHAAGYDVPPIMRRFYLARTVGEFWWRYNTRVHAWLERNVLSLIGRRRRTLGVFAVFFYSAAFHELMFDIAMSRIEGYQFAFFMLQAPAALASPGIERLAQRGGIAGKMLAHVVTIAWFYFTSLLFFRGVERIFPITYASEPWLP